MNVVIVGKGGREAALAYRIAQSPKLGRLIVTGRNPGWPDAAQVIEATANDDIVALALRESADLVVVGPEAPLAEGLGDALRSAGVACFGPDRQAAQLETSKAFAKDVLQRARVPTAAAVVVDRRVDGDRERARERCSQGRVAVKVDGLAAGKGVFVCHTADEALSALGEAWSDRFGPAADRLVLEDLLEGPEVSVFALCDGSRAVALPSAQDHKRIFDGDQGPNTGGMGAYAPCPLLDQAAADEIVRTCYLPVLRVLTLSGMPFRGVLFGGLMLTDRGPKVLEFNVRFGDPETQALMALWDDDILPWLHGAAIGRLPSGRPRFADGAACCVVLASAGYPASSTKGVAIAEPGPQDGVIAFHAGTRRGDDGVLRTDGGRVLGVTAMGPDLSRARAAAYAAVPGWAFEGAQHRTDIGAKGLL